MVCQIIKPSKKILVIGNISQLPNPITSIQNVMSANNYEYVIINGGRCDNIDTLLSKDQKIIYVVGREDFISSSTSSDVFKWISNKPNVVIAQYLGRSVIIVDGGIPNTIKTKNDLVDNLEPSFVLNQEWNKSYGGHLGYIITNNIKSNDNKYYSYSMSIGNGIAQEVDNKSLKNSIDLRKLSHY